MASQTLHDLLDDAENAWRKIQGIRPAVDAELRATFDALRQHADKLVDDVADDARAAEQQIASDVRADAAPIVTDVTSAVSGLEHTVESAGSTPAEPPDAAPQENPAAQSAPAEPSDTQPAA